MAKHNPENEFAKRDYLLWLKNAEGRSEATVDAAAAAIDRYEAQTRFKSFKTFRREHAISFKEHLAREVNAAGKSLSKATIYSTLNAVRAFFEWLAREQGYRKSIVPSDIAYFKPTDNDARTATARRERPAPSLEQVRHVINSMPTDTPLQRRDRAVIALIILTGARDAAARSLKLKHLDTSARMLFQDAREVQTKRAKTLTTVYFPVGEDFERIVADWKAELERDHHFGPDDPLFPSTQVGVDDRGLFAAIGLTRECWTSASPIRELFRNAFERAGLPYANPHSLRRTLMRVAYERKLTHKQLKAWSQNLGHESVITSVVSYGTLSPDEQADAMNELADEAEAPDEEVIAIARQLMRVTRQQRAAAV